MTRLLIYAGPNGSGKSSLRDSDAHSDPVDILIDADLIARHIDPVDPRRADRAAGRAALQLFHQGLQSRCSMSLETTLAGHSILQRLHAAKHAGYHLELRYVALALVALNVQRVQARARLGGHPIDPVDIRRRHARSLANLAKALLLVDRAIISDNTGPQPRPIVEVVAGRVVRTVSDPRPWLAPILCQIAGGDAPSAG